MGKKHVTGSPTADLSRRERQIMDILYERGQATAQDVLERLPDPPSYSAVRSMLRLLKEKGHLRHHQDGPRYVYEPTLPREKAQRSAVHHLLKTFFDGSTERAVATLLDLSTPALSEDALDELAHLIERRKQEGR